MPSWPFCNRSLGDLPETEWSQLLVVPAPLGQQYGNPLFGGGQGTGGQTSTHGLFLKMRNVGAAMWVMTVAAASRWGVKESGIAVSSGVVTGAQGRSLTFGELAEEAVKQPVPETISSFDAAAAFGFPGVSHVFEVVTGIAVVGTNFWSVYEAGNLIKVEWDDSSPPCGDHHHEAHHRPLHGACRVRDPEPQPSHQRRPGRCLGWIADVLHGRAGTGRGRWNRPVPGRLPRTESSARKPGRCTGPSRVERGTRSMRSTSCSRR